MTASPTGAIALWWMIINWVQYSDVLAFQRGPYSAQFQQTVSVDLGVLPTKGSLLVSLDTSAWAIWHVMGIAVLCATVAGLAVALVRDGVSTRCGSRPIAFSSTKQRIPPSFAWALDLIQSWPGAAAWRALYQLLVSPFHWERTPHGLTDTHAPPSARGL
jgi:hypothetical protein